MYGRHGFVHLALAQVPLFTLIFPVSAQNNSFDVLDYVNPLIGTTNGGNADLSGIVSGYILIFPRTCFCRGLAAIW